MQGGVALRDKMKLQLRTPNNKVIRKYHHPIFSPTPGRSLRMRKSAVHWSFELLDILTGPLTDYEKIIIQKKN